MEYLEHRCGKSGDGKLIFRNGKTKDGHQRYKCKLCSKRFFKSRLLQSLCIFVQNKCIHPIEFRGFETPIVQPKK